MNFTLITGASKGIGKALAEAFANRGQNLILIARTEKTLREVASDIEDRYNVTAVFLAKDLNEENAAHSIFNWCKEHKYTVNILVNNAGFGLHGYFHKMKEEELLKILNLNINSIILLSHLFIPELKKVKNSHILNVSSTAAFQPVPYLNLYAATKAFLNSFSGALREEVQEYGINVSCLAPGPTDSDFFNKSGVENDIDLSTVKMKPEEVAEIGVEGMFNKKALIVPGISNKFGAFFSKRISSTPIVKLIGKLFKPKK
ncbi:MAG: SDR family oxidoreductase [Bacteroidota bacterium]|jgi:short-subunit dehydrogenase|nr:SDR family oxidoreductase [Bacteroidota bacterium]